MARADGRQADELRPLKIERNYISAAPGSVLIAAGETTVLCTASLESRVPPWLEGKGKGWITAEYNMLPGSTSPRKQRDRKKVDGRTTEIQRLIGRSMRAVADLEALGEQMITVDCDVLKADGGTRTLSITGGLIALVDAIHSIKSELPDPEKFPLRSNVAAISVGVCDGIPVLDLPYVEDVSASVDMNVVMTGQAQYIEVQGTGEESTFSDDELLELLRLSKIGIVRLTAAQKESLGNDWPFA